VERALSHYWHFVNDGREDLDPLAAVTRRDDYVARSDYARQLRPYLDTFGRRRIYTLTLEELERDPAGAMRALFAWLDVDPGCPVTTTRVNVGRGQMTQTRRHLVALDTMMKHWRWQQQIAPYLPGPLPRVLRSLVYRRVDRTSTPVDAAIQYLRAVLQPRTHDLAALLDCDVGAWTTTFPRTASSSVHR
jgi:hypothetical protein